MTDRTCTVDGCEGSAYCKGWCTKHYQRWRNHGSTDHPRPSASGNCSVEGCVRPARTRGWCGTHYSRWFRQGTIEDAQPRVSESCAVDGCDRSAGTRGWCEMHYLRWLRHGSTEDPIPRCAVDGCDKRVLTNDLCQTHRWRQKTHGSFDLPGANPTFGTKWCRKCKTYQPLSEFYVGKKGPESPCKQCRAIRDKAYRKANPPRNRPGGNRRRRALMRAARSEPYTAVEIADRDGWKCQRCGERIGRTLKWPHPRSLSIDHIIPVTRGGDDLKVNVQAAHLRCNERKGNRGVDQLRLIG